MSLISMRSKRHCCTTLRRLCCEPRNKPRPTFNARNLISGLADAYTTDASTNEPPHVRRDRARHIVAEAMGYIFSQNFLAEAGEDGVGVQHQVTRLSKSIKTRQDCEG